VRVLLTKTRASAVRPANARVERLSMETIFRIVRGSCNLSSERGRERGGGGVRYARERRIARERERGRTKRGDKFGETSRKSGNFHSCNFPPSKFPLH